MSGAELSGTHVRYLAAIYAIGKGGNTISSAEVARMLGVSRPSVTRMLVVLSDKGMTSKERYGKIELTSDGLRIARIVEKHTAYIAQLLCAGMDLTPSEAMTAAAAVAAALPDRILPLDA